MTHITCQPEYVSGSQKTAPSPAFQAPSPVGRGKRAAFTLAEVLITLGIIGVVAAMTLPALIQHHRKQVVETSLAKFYSVMNQAIQQSEIDNGPKEYWPIQLNGFEEDDDGNKDLSKSKFEPFFNKYLKPYLQISKTKINNRTGGVEAYFTDGSLCIFAGSSYQFYPKASDFNGYKNNDNQYAINPKEDSGIKYFTFFFAPSGNSNSNKYHYKKGLEPYKYDWNGTESMLLNNSSIGCNKDATNERAYCTALIQMNGWKIPKNYPLKF